MNERIRELIWETDEWLESNAQSDRWEREIKFAQLIVKECAEHLESSVLVPNSEHSRVKWKCIRAIKEHFGVEP